MEPKPFVPSAFAFAWMANVDNKPGATGDVQDLANQLAKDIDDKLANAEYTQVIGTNWTRVWGPWVFQAGSDNSVLNNSKKPITNCIFCAYDSEQNAYVVAIAGTNPISQYDWSFEDCSVDSLVPISSGSTACFSQGTSRAVGFLSAMGADGKPSGSNAAGSWATNDGNGPKQCGLISLQSFLGTVETDATTTLNFTGHSLGGALAPAMAMVLFNTDSGLISTSGTSPWAANSVSVTPFAGPSVGNDKYVSLYTKTFQDSKAYLNHINMYDIVPIAWAPDTFPGNIRTVYANNFTFSSALDNLVTKINSAILNAFGGANPYVQMPTQWKETDTTFRGEFQKPPSFSVYFNELKPAERDCARQTCQFIAEAAYQHVNAYPLQFADSLAEKYNPTSEELAYLIKDIYDRLVKDNVLSCQQAS